MSKTIMIVDDSPTEMKLMMSALSNKGYNIVTAVDGEEALSKVGTIRPDLILLDVVMPKKNGYQVCRSIKTAPATKDIRVLLVTSKDQETDRFWGMKQGADGYLTKPYKPEDLVAAVSRYA